MPFEGRMSVHLAAHQLAFATVEHGSAGESRKSFTKLEEAERRICRERGLKSAAFGRKLGEEHVG